MLYTSMLVTMVTFSYMTSESEYVQAAVKLSHMTPQPITESEPSNMLIDDGYRTCTAFIQF